MSSWRSSAPALARAGSLGEAASRYMRCEIKRLAIGRVASRNLAAVREHADLRLRGGRL